MMDTQSFNANSWNAALAEVQRYANEMLLGLTDARSRGMLADLVRFMEEREIR